MRSAAGLLLVLGCCWSASLVAAPSADDCRTEAPSCGALLTEAACGRRHGAAEPLGGGYVLDGGREVPCVWQTGVLRQWQCGVAKGFWPLERRIKRCPADAAPLAAAAPPPLGEVGGLGVEFGLGGTGYKSGTYGTVRSSHAAGSGSGAIVSVDAQAGVIVSATVVAGGADYAADDALLVLGGNNDGYVKVDRIVAPRAPAAARTAEPGGWQDNAFVHFAIVLWGWGLSEYCMVISGKKLPVSAAMFYNCCGLCLVNLPFFTQVQPFDASIAVGALMAAATGILYGIGDICFFRLAKGPAVATQASPDHFTSASVLAPICGLYVIIPIVLGVLIQREPLTLRKAGGLLLALVAIWLLSEEDDDDDSDSDESGETASETEGLLGSDEDMDIETPRRPLIASWGASWSTVKDRDPDPGP